LSNDVVNNIILAEGHGWRERSQGAP